MNDKPRKRPLADEVAGGRGDGLDANSEIGSKLKAFYSSVQDEPIPDKFLELLEKLDALERSGARPLDS
ncbi:MAG: NepR family anti-sigma factor [Pararhizobium sp.]